MANGPGSTLQDLHTIWVGGATAGLTDQQLLERFAARRGREAETAFAALVARHGPMVLGICRRWLRNPADASDAFQATFLVLMRRADRLELDTGHSLGPWLHGVSVKVARRILTDAMRRHARERTNAELPEPPARGEGVAGEPWSDLRAVLDEELRALAVGYRTVVVLCHLEGLTHEEAARQLGWPVGTVRSRLARGRARLRDRLTRRGLGLSLTAGLVDGNPRAVVSDDLLQTTARAAARLVAGQAPVGVVPSGVISLVARVDRAMTLRGLGR